MRPAGRGQAFEKPDLHKRPDRAAHARLGQAERFA
jgi:hypothetical protein